MKRRQHPKSPADLLFRGLILAAILWVVAFVLTWLGSELVHYHKREFSTPNLSRQ